MLTAVKVQLVPLAVMTILLEPPVLLKLALVAEGVWEGRIVDCARGTGGFGYDPHFWVPELNRTAAELEPADKNQVSHRGAALSRLRTLLARATR